MELHINVENPDEAELLSEMLGRYFSNRDSAVSGVHQFQPDGTNYTVTEMRTSRGWHWFINEPGRIGPLASAWAEERRSETPGAAEPGSFTKFVVDSVRTLDVPDGVNAQRYGSPVDSTVRDILDPFRRLV